MADLITMFSDEQTHFHIKSFRDVLGNPENVDAIRWRVADESVCTVLISADGMDCDLISVDRPLDGSPASTQFFLEIDEAGVQNAMGKTWDVTVQALASLPAVSVEVEVGAPTKKTPTP